MLTYRPRAKTTCILLHASHTLPAMSNLAAFLAVEGRRQGLLTVGYHYLILQDGKLVECRPHTVQGTHCRAVNRESIGVCLAGGLGEPEPHCINGHDRCFEGPSPGCPHCEQRSEPEDNFTPDQWLTLLWLHGYLHQFYGDLPIRGHSEAVPNHRRQCPPTDMEKVRSWITSSTT